MRSHRVLALPRMSVRRPVAVLALCGAVALSACGNGDPSIRTEPDTSTTTSTTAPEPTTSTTLATTPGGDGQIVRYGGLEFVVPTTWVVYDLTASPHTCVRVDVHAVYLGAPGAEQDCPAHLVGHTEAVILQPLAGASDVVVARATVPGVINGMAVRTDPNPDVNGALTVVFPDLGVLAYVSYGASQTPADTLLAGFTPATG